MTWQNSIDSEQLGNVQNFRIGRWAMELHWEERTSLRDLLFLCINHIQREIAAVAETPTIESIIPRRLRPELLFPANSQEKKIVSKWLMR
jgi:hypothetical protein